MLPNKPSPNKLAAGQCGVYPICFSSMRPIGCAAGFSKVLHYLSEISLALLGGNVSGNSCRITSAPHSWRPGLSLTGVALIALFAGSIPTTAGALPDPICKAKFAAPGEATIRSWLAGSGVCLDRPCKTRSQLVDASDIYAKANPSIDELLALANLFEGLVKKGSVCLSAQWYQRAVVAGSDEAILRLGKMLAGERNGLRFENGWEVAQAYLEAAARSGQTGASESLLELKERMNKQVATRIKLAQLVSAAYRIQSAQQFHDLGAFFVTGGANVREGGLLPEYGQRHYARENALPWYVLAASLGSADAFLELVYIYNEYKSESRSLLPLKNKSRSFAILLAARAKHAGNAHRNVDDFLRGAPRSVLDVAEDERLWAAFKRDGEAAARKIINSVAPILPQSGTPSVEEVRKFLESVRRESLPIVNRLTGLGAMTGPPIGALQPVLHDQLVRAVTARHPVRDMFNAYAGKIADAECDSSVCTVNGGLGKVRWLVVDDPACERLDKKPDPSWLNWTSAEASPRWNCRFRWQMDFQVDVRPLGLPNIPGYWGQRVLDGITRAETFDGEMVLEFKDGKWTSISGVLKGSDGRIEW